LAAPFLPHHLGVLLSCLRVAINEFSLASAFLLRFCPSGFLLVLIRPFTSSFTASLHTPSRVFLAFPPFLQPYLYQHTHVTASKGKTAERAEKKAAEKSEVREVNIFHCTNFVAKLVLLKLYLYKASTLPLFTQTSRNIAFLSA